MKKLHNQFSQLRTPACIGVVVAIALLSTGCSYNTLQQREQALSSQQQQLALAQQQLENEKRALTTLKEEIDQEKNRLEVLKKQPASHTVTDEQTTNNTRVIVGEAEYVYISPPDIKLSARIDTGAKTSSLNALDLVEFERDGKPYARFSVMDPVSGETIEIERRIRKRVRIKEHDGEAQRRPVVKIRVRLGSLDQRIEMTLTDRSKFEHQVLIGRNFLRDYAIVDVSKKYISQPVIEKN